MDYALRNTLVWLYISVVILLGVGLLWIASISTFWMFPVLTTQPPTLATFLGLGMRGAIWSITAGAWTFVSILGWRRLEKDVDRLLKGVDS